MSAPVHASGNDPMVDDDSSTRPHAPQPAPGPRAAIALLREQQWLAALAGVIVLSVVFCFLGRWQWHRHEARSARNAVVDANYGAPAVPLAQLLPEIGYLPIGEGQGHGGGLPGRLQWRTVLAAGHYLTGQTILLRNRPLNDQNGYDVAVPLQTDAGPVLWIDRGWIPAGTSTAARPDSVPAAPTGPVTVTSRLRPSEEHSNRSAPAGQANRLDVTDVSAALEEVPSSSIVAAYGTMVTETPPAATAPQSSPRPDPGLGINLAYAVQWVAFAIAAYVLFGVALVREARRRVGYQPEPRRRRLRLRDIPDDE